MKHSSSLLRLVGLLLGSLLLFSLCACSAAQPSAHSSTDSQLEEDDSNEAAEAQDLDFAVVVVDELGSDDQATGRQDPSIAGKKPDSPWLPVSSKDPMWGASLAPVTIVEFLDFECPFCGRVQSTLKRLQLHYGREKLRIVWKNHPLPFHDNAMGAHEAAMAVFERGGDEAFWRFHDRLFENRKSLTEENFKKWAEDVGVPWREVQRLVVAGIPAKKIAEDEALAKRLNANGTPAFFVNGEKISGARPLKVFIEVIDRELKESAALIKDGASASEIYPRRVAAHEAELRAPKPKKKRNASPSADVTVWKIPVYDDDPVRGSEDALVTIVEFSEFQCPFCKRVEPSLARILSEYEGQVRLIWKDSPLAFHPNALPAAILARTVYKHQGNAAFWKFHDFLFKAQPALRKSDLKHYLKETGLSYSTHQRDVTSGVHARKIRQSQELAYEFQARGTPHFFINGRRLKGAQPFEKLQALIEEELIAARQLLSRGIPREKIYETLIKDAQVPPPPPKKELAPLTHRAPYRGRKHALVTIYQFSDFQCPFCSRVNPKLKLLLKKYRGKLSLVWRNLPLPFHKEAPLAAEAAYEVFLQKGNAAFFRYHDSLFASQKPPGLDRSNLEALAQKQGINIQRLRRALDQRTHRPIIESDKRAASAAGISGTPAFIINGYFLSGSQPLISFERIIDRSLRDLQ